VNSSASYLSRRSSLDEAGSMIGGSDCGCVVLLALVFVLALALALALALMTSS